MARSGEAGKRTAATATLRASFPSTAELLVEGGDARITLGDGITNKYGCTPFPDTGLLAFGSSTASIISPPAFAAANRLRDRLALASSSEVPGQTYARELNRIRAELKSLCNVADMPELDIVFGASGTDLHLIASQITSGAASTRVIMAGIEETGSSVPSALTGKHFSTRSSLGQAVEAGKPIAGSHRIELSTVPIRDSQGMPRPIADIDSDIELLANEATARNQRILLIVTDVSKTGMIAPSPACAIALHRRLPQSVDVLVDACQFRIAPATLRAYLEQDFMVAVTGSKFITGPTFSGALLLPAAVAHRLREQPLPPSLAPYSARADWPDDWRHADIFGNVANFGLLLRWEAALEELRPFRAIPEEQVARFLDAFAGAARQMLQGHSCFQMLPVPVLDRRSIAQANGWDQCQTIFPFLLYRSAANGSNMPLSREQTMQVYRLLQDDLGDGLRCQLGQPVACGSRHGIPVSALRICASTRLAVEGCAQNGKNAQAVIERALVALGKTAILVETGRFQK
jgi:hypothetical protein